MKPSTLADGTYSYIRPTMGPRDITVTAQILGGQLTEGTYDGKPMTGSCWRGCTLADLNNLAFTFEPAAQPIGKARAFEMHKQMARAGYPTAHADLASGVLGREIRHLRTLTEAEARAVWAALTRSAAA
jgi:hypothetical protein